jgi:iron complex outermembrane receptor protein
MKKFAIGILMGLSVSQSYGQQPVNRLDPDSTRYIVLDEIQLTGKQKTTRQSLIQFFRANNAASLEEIMGRLPELSFIRRGPYGMEPTIRSLSSGQINTLVDGMRIHGACTDKMDPPTIYIEPANLENIQVQTTNNGSFVGSSIGGTVNLKIADPDFNNAKKISGSLNSGYQSAANAFYESLKLNYTAGKLAIRASATYRKADDYRSGGGETVEYSQYEKINYSVSAKYLVNNHTWIKADLLGDNGWNIGYPALPMDVGSASALIGSLSMGSEKRTRLFQSWVAKFYANNVIHNMDDTQRPDAPIHMDMPGMSKTYGSYGEAKWNLTNKQSLQIRGDISATYLKASMTMYQPGQLPMYMLTWPDHWKYQSGLAASWHYYLDSSWDLSVNGRTDLINYRLASEDAKEEIAILGYPSADRNDLLKNISGQLGKKLSNTIKTSLGIAYNERVPTGSELYGFYLFNAQDNYDYIGNATLSKESSLQAELNFVYQKKAQRLQVTGFYNRINDFIVGFVDPSLSSMTIGASGVKKYENIPYATLTGIELSAMIMAVKQLFFVTTLKYTYAIDNNAQPLAMIPPLKNIGSVRFQPGRFSVQAEYEAAASQKKVNPEAGEDATNGYLIFHGRLGLNLDIFKTNSDLQFGVENILDKNYHEHLDWGNIPRPGRNVYAMIKFSF